MYLQVIGDDIEVRLSMYSVEFKRYILKTAVRKSWHQEPSEPNFIRLIINAGKRSHFYNKRSRFSPQNI